MHSSHPPRFVSRNRALAALFFVGSPNPPPSRAARPPPPSPSNQVYPSLPIPPQLKSNATHRSLAKTEPLRLGFVQGANILLPLCTARSYLPASQPRCTPHRQDPLNANQMPPANRYPKPSPSGSVFGGGPNSPHSRAPLDCAPPPPQPRVTPSQTDPLYTTNPPSLVSPRHTPSATSCPTPPLPVASRDSKTRSTDRFCTSARVLREGGDKKGGEKTGGWREETGEEQGEQQMRG